MSELLHNIQHFVVLMLENRSFDHLFGYLKTSDPRIEGLTGNESNPANPAVPGSPETKVSRATAYTMPFDPGHEFSDVQYQLYAPSGAPADSAAMKGFLGNAWSAAQPFPNDAPLVMQCFQPDQLPVLTTLAREFALFNRYHSSLPGPSWPNRLFIHAATSGGLTGSPGAGDIVDGFSFKSGTIYDALARAGKHWRIYHDGLPQSAVISSLRNAYVDPFTKSYRDMSFFQQDVASNDLPEYTFIEPNYDSGHNYQKGNSMHPLSDVRNGELLIKKVYESLRQSAFWVGTMLIITFDDHGGFYDHVSPPATVASGDDSKYANSAHRFSFQRLGVRVPCIAISPYTKKGTVVGDQRKDAKMIFDHASILATVERRYRLPPLTNRDKEAKTLEAALNISKPRMTAADALITLPNPATNLSVPEVTTFAAMGVMPSTAATAAPLLDHQKSLLDLALACDLQVSPRSEHNARILRRTAVHQHNEAEKYIREVENKIRSNRQLEALNASGADPSIQKSQFGLTPPREFRAPAQPEGKSFIPKAKRIQLRKDAGRFISHPKIEIPSNKRLAAFKAIKADSSIKWVLVAGSGTQQLAEKLVETSRLLGAELAREGFGLVSGGWAGVDHIAARAFAEAVKMRGNTLFSKLLQITERGRMPDFSAGQNITTPSENEAWQLSIAKADAVVLIGGLGGTYETGHAARKLRKPVLPIADTREAGHDDAYRTYFEMKEAWESESIAGLTYEDFNRLGDPAPGVVAEVMRNLELVFARLSPIKMKRTKKSRGSVSSAPQQFDVFLSHNSKNKPMAREVKKRLSIAGLTVWFDEDELRPGIPWQHLLEEGIKASKSVVVLVGGDGLGPWENEEMEAALQKAVKNGLPVIPVLLPGAPANPNLQMFLENRTWVDMRAGTNKEVWDRLLWGITGRRPNH